MNSLEEQNITWNEPTTNESLVVIRSVLSQNGIDHGTGLFLTIQRYLYFDIGLFERRTRPIPC